MEPAAAKLIGAGIACIGMGGAGVGVGIIDGVQHRILNCNFAVGFLELLLQRAHCPLQLIYFEPHVLSFGSDESTLSG